MTFTARSWWWVYLLSIGVFPLCATSCRKGQDSLQETTDSLKATPVDTAAIVVSATDSAQVRAIEQAAPRRGIWANALDVVQPPPPDSAKIAARFARMYALSMRSYYIYYASALVHRRAAFDWQLRSAQISFYVVLVLVLSGLVFAGIQFARGRDEKVSSLKLSSNGLEMSSPVLGVIILGLSLAFFYLYIIHVYPIHEAIAGG